MKDAALGAAIPQASRRHKRSSEGRPADGSLSYDYIQRSKTCGKEIRDSGIITYNS